jgi:hypothetical protein
LTTWTTGTPGLSWCTEAVAAAVIVIAMSMAAINERRFSNRMEMKEKENGK